MAEDSGNSAHYLLPYSKIVGQEEAKLALELAYISNQRIGLDDYLANLILDAAAMGVVELQREGREQTLRSEFILVGTMTPEEGGLRPQLLDRFGLMVSIATSNKMETRQQILRNVLEWDEVLATKDRFYKTDTNAIVDKCIEVAEAFQATGHRGEVTMALAARAYVALRGDDSANIDHLHIVAPLALQHRRMDIQQSEQVGRSKNDTKKLADVLGENS